MLIQWVVWGSSPVKEAAAYGRIAMVGKHVLPPLAPIDALLSWANLDQNEGANSDGEQCHCSLGVCQNTLGEKKACSSDTMLGKHWV